MKQLLQLRRAITQNVWLMERSSAEAYLPTVIKIIKGEFGDIASLEKEKFKSFTIGVKSGIVLDLEEGDTELPETVEQDSIAVIPLLGPIMKYDSWCETGTQTKAKQLLTADADPRIRGSIILTDSPGGEALATEVMHNAIKKCEKMVVGVVDGMMASAAVWIVSGTDHIFLNGETCLVGSIGTMITLADFRSYYEKEGIKIHDIYADDSTDKNKEWRDAVDGKYDLMKQRLLNPLNDLFKNTVINNRASLNKENTLTGKVFLSKEAIANGLADEIGGMQSAIDYIMFNTKYKKLDQFKGKQKLSLREQAEVQRILKSAGIPVSLSMPKSLLYDTDDGKKIYVYAEEGEDPVGKQCVYADDQGNATDQNLEDGDHLLADGSTLTSSTKDGLSYVDSISEASPDEEGAETEEQPTEQKDKGKKPTAKTGKSSAKSEKKKPTELEAALELFGDKLLTKVDEKITALKNEITSGGEAPGATNGAVNAGQAKTGKSKIAARMEEITQRNKLTSKK